MLVTSTVLLFYRRNDSLAMMAILKYPYSLMRIDILAQMYVRSRFC